MKEPGWEEHFLNAEQPVQVSAAHSLTGRNKSQTNSLPYLGIASVSTASYLKPLLFYKNNTSNFLSTAWSPLPFQAATCNCCIILSCRFCILACTGFISTSAVICILPPSLSQLDLLRVITEIQEWVIFFSCRRYIYSLQSLPEISGQV